MTAGPSSYITKDLVDHPTPLPSLEDTFQHPAGLPFARSLVRALIHAQRSDKPLCRASSPMSFPSTFWPPEFREILAFGDSQRAPCALDSGSAKSQGATGGTVVGRQGTMQALGGERRPEAINTRQNDLRRLGFEPQYQLQRRASTHSQAVREVPSASASGAGSRATSQSDFIETSVTPLNSIQNMTPSSHAQLRRHALPLLLPASQRTHPQAPQLRLAPAPRSISSTEFLQLNNCSFGKTEKMPSKKRKSLLGDSSQLKRQKTIKTTNSKRGPKPKDKSGSAAYKLDEVLWMRILEFSPPSFLFKARLISKTFKGIIDRFDSIFINCCKENYGAEMPLAPAGLKVKQYLDLLQGKGCLESHCGDKKASKTSWSWAKRWCATCWKNKLEREDRVIKSRQNDYTRATLTKMLECLPAGMHDSFLKPHDFVDDMDSRPRGAPRLYKYYMTEDITKIIEEYEALTPAPFVDDPSKTAEENTFARDSHQAQMDALDDKRTAFFAERKAKNDAHMTTVKQIEAGIRKRMLSIRKRHDECRNARKDLFLRRAREELPHIPQDDISRLACYKAAVRIFRDRGTERGWLTLKAKIEKEWKADNGEVDQESGNTQSLDWTDDWDSLFVDQSGTASISASETALQSLIDSQRSSYVTSASSAFPASGRDDTTSIDALAAVASYINGSPPENGLPSSFILHSSSATFPSLTHSSNNLVTPLNGAPTSTQISVSSLLRPQTPSTLSHYNSFTHTRHP